MQYQIQPNFVGGVRPPADLLGAARNSLNETDFAEFIARHGENFTPDQLCQFCDEVRERH